MSMVAVEAMHGDRSIAELEQQFDVYAKQIRDKKSHLLKRSKNVLLISAERHSLNSAPTVQELQAKIGEFTMETDYLERALGKLEGPSAGR